MSNTLTLDFEDAVILLQAESDVMAARIANNEIDLYDVMDMTTFDYEVGTILIEQEDAEIAREYLAFSSRVKLAYIGSVALVRQAAHYRQDTGIVEKLAEEISAVSEEYTRALEVSAKIADFILVQGYRQARSAT